MEGKNTLLKNLEAADSDMVTLDAACKKLLANRQILAWILKSCVEEYKDCSIKEIEQKYIEGTPEVAKTALHQDEIAEQGEVVAGSRNEDNSMREGTVNYDIKFDVLKPSRYTDDTDVKYRRRTIHMIINVEGQADFYPGYPLPKRGIYYGSRMISSQYGTVFTNSHYEQIRKVYSIWICVNPPEYRKNSINIYSFHESQIVGTINESKENYDLITVVMVCLGDEDSKDCDKLIRLLSVLLYMEKGIDEKKTILKNEFDIVMTKTMEKEASEVCDYSKYVERKGIEKGIEQGIEKGIAKGIAEGIEKGIAQGEELLLSLMERLFADGRTDDAMLAVRDERVRRKFYQEYGIACPMR